MVCSSFIRSFIVQAGGHIGVLAQGRHQFNHIKKTFSVGFGFRTSVIGFRTSVIGFRRTCGVGFRTSAKMMVDSSAGEKRISLVDMPPEKVDDGGYIGGGWKNDNGSLSCGYCSFRGKRSTMEDFYDVKASTIEGQTVCMFGIFDGHGGSRAAEYLKEHLFNNLMKHPQFLTDTKLALNETYKQTDVAFLESEKDTYRDDGSTASAAVLVGNHLYVANVGDSRTIVSKAGKAIALSDDHKPNRSDERKRIESAGGVIMWAGTWRVGGVLAMSRAFGNRMLKQFVVAEPEIQDLEIDHEAELLVLASDGLWDVVPNEDAVTLAQSEEEPEAAARKLTDTAFARGSADNITCIVVKFRHDKNESPKIEPNAIAESEPELNPAAEVEPESNLNTEMETESSPKAEVESNPDAIPDPKPETEPETKGEKAGE
ncbi:PPM-type phosphatase domain [Arabidopsis thaliana x Arabidopsis arenosa]|uniref:protein-serine/threonine phosphatase n=1 Tax=Arabidopsis thaliana x Arabidopsis arenosa TaxID=1240361 RepID=A0A8T1XHQ4_9BRAS|nr:PPM-type phosphatase domain [Arabidopsis thaliana x Arabidopsis arenosa]